MSQSNDVFQIIPVPATGTIEGGSAVVVTSGNVSALKPGQIGVFDSETNTAVDGSAVVKKFYIARGIGTVGTATLEDLAKSSGTYIKTADVVAYNFQDYVAPINAVVTITSGAIPVADTDYTVRVESRNEEIYKLQGYVQFSQNYTVNIPTGGTLTKANLSTLLAAEINLDSANSYLTAAVSGDDLVITTVPVGKADFNSIKMGYYKCRSTVAIAALTSGFNTASTVVYTTNAVNEQGSGYDIKQKEYQAGGWNGNPGLYRQDGVTGLAKQINYLTDYATNYAQIALTYAARGEAGWDEYKSDLATVVAIPSGDAAVVAFMNVINGAIGTAPAPVSKEVEVNAGPDATQATSVDTFTMAGTGTTGATFLWEQVGATPSVAVITTAASLTTGLTGLDTAGTYVFKLTGTLGAESETDTMEIVVTA